MKNDVGGGERRLGITVWILGMIMAEGMRETNEWLLVRTSLPNDK